MVKLQGNLRGRLRSGLGTDGLDHRTPQEFTVHLQSGQKALITHESQKFLTYVNHDGDSFS
jgi:hypothetical protein